MSMSEKSVGQKHGLKAGETLLVRHPPNGIEEILGASPDGTHWTEMGDGPFPTILTFARDRAAMVKELASCKAKLDSGGALWIAYAKTTSSKATDINRGTIREYVATVGLDTVSQIAIDADWSALRLKVV
jgi:hypothetical protein